MTYSSAHQSSSLAAAAYVRISPSLRVDVLIGMVVERDVLCPEPKPINERCRRGGQMQEIVFEQVDDGIIRQRHGRLCRPSEVAAAGPFIDGDEAHAAVVDDPASRVVDPIAEDEALRRAEHRDAVLQTGFFGRPSELRLCLGGGLVGEAIEDVNPLARQFDPSWLAARYFGRDVARTRRSAGHHRRENGWKLYINIHRRGARTHTFWR